MKHRILLLVFILVSCGNRKTVTNQSHLKKGETLDSLKIEESIDKIITINQHKNVEEEYYFELESIDTLPLIYTKEVNGKVVEKTTLSGGRLLKKKKTNSTVTEKNNTEQKENKNVKIHRIRTEKIEQKNNKQEVISSHFNSFLSYLFLYVIVYFIIKYLFQKIFK